MGSLLATSPATRNCERPLERVTASIDSRFMADPLSSLIRPNLGPQLPAFERFAPPPPDNVVVAELAARTAPGDVVIDTHGRGGWIARNAIAALRRVYALESTALTRLLAEIVLRPPDLRHFDAGLQAVATIPHGDSELKRHIDQSFMTRCPTCGRPVVVQEYVWDAGADAPQPQGVSLFVLPRAGAQQRTTHRGRRR